MSIKKPCRRITTPLSSGRGKETADHVDVVELSAPGELPEATHASACNPPTFARSAVYLGKSVFSFGEREAKLPLGSKAIGVPERPNVIHKSCGRWLFGG
jgi:hypothetical protein